VVALDRQGAAVLARVECGDRHRIWFDVARSASRRSVIEVSSSARTAKEVAFRELWLTP
jgi:hypothetical protein